MASPLRLLATRTRPTTTSKALTTSRVVPVPVVGRAPVLLAAVVVAAWEVGLTDDGVEVGPVGGTVVGPVVAGMVVGAVVVVDGADWQLLAVVTNGAAIRPRESPLPVKTALMSIWPHWIGELSVADVAPAGMIAETSLTFGLDEMPRCDRSRIGVSVARGASSVIEAVAIPLAVTSKTTVKVVPSMVRELVQLTGAACTVWLPPHSGKADAAPVVARASPAVSPARARAAKPRCRARARPRVEMMVAIGSSPGPPVWRGTLLSGLPASAAFEEVSCLSNETRGHRRSRASRIRANTSSSLPSPSTRTSRPSPSRSERSG